METRLLIDWYRTHPLAREFAAEVVKAARGGLDKKAARLRWHIERLEPIDPGSFYEALWKAGLARIDYREVARVLLTEGGG